MRCNRNCSCNTNCRQNRCNMQQSNRGQFNRSQFNRPAFNECNVFAASNTGAATTVTGATATPLPLTNILYSYGSAIQAASGGTTIYITQPGLYQVSYCINAANAGATGAAAGIVTAYLLRNTTQFGTTTSDSLAVGDSGILADTEIFYVSCQDLPVTLSLTTSSTATVTNYNYFITINRICSCVGNSNSFGSGFEITDGTTTPSFNGGFNGSFNGGFIGCNTGFGSDFGSDFGSGFGPDFGVDFGGPGPVVGGSFGCNSGCNSGCGSNGCCN